MSVVTVSARFQVLIPRHIQESLRLEPGQKLMALQYEGRVELVPVRPAASFRGFLRGLATDVPRGDDRL
jgi:AbrB family looped-hinge helix DNA binding protein